MATTHCQICGEAVPAGSLTCAVCGTRQAESTLPIAVVLGPQTGWEQAPLATIVEGQLRCPSCGQVYVAEETDGFCSCGAELRPGTPIASATGKPPAGTPCLALIDAKRQPIHYFPLTKDATLIGRLDAVSGNFPEVDLDPWLDASSRRRISRQHALLLHHRATNTWSIRPLPGNTGTQRENEMLAANLDHALQPGARIILGGAIRLRFEES